MIRTLTRFAFWLLAWLLAFAVLLGALFVGQARVNANAAVPRVQTVQVYFDGANAPLDVPKRLVHVTRCFDFAQDCRARAVGLTGWVRYPGTIKAHHPRLACSTFGMKVRHALCKTNHRQGSAWTFIGRYDGHRNCYELVGDTTLYRCAGLTETS